MGDGGDDQEAPDDVDRDVACERAPTVGASGIVGVDIIHGGSPGSAVEQVRGQTARAGPVCSDPAPSRAGIPYSGCIQAVYGPMRLWPGITGAGGCPGPKSEGAPDIGGSFVACAGSVVSFVVVASAVAQSAQRGQREGGEQCRG
jgi:hypothetical protein